MVRGRVVLFSLVVALAGSAVAAAATTPAKQFAVVFPEGFTRARMIDQVAAVRRIAQRELRAVHEPTQLALSGAAYASASARVIVPCFGSGRQKHPEGFLFPATYSFDVRTLGSNIVANQIAAFCATWSKLDLAYSRSKNLTPYDVLTVASMVEAEAALPGDRMKVAAVIYNRLRLNMALGIDAALRYGLHIPPTKSITDSELASTSPYNTRHTQGLPSTPIANPGLASIRAAAHPAKVDYLYYVRKPDKVHHFFTASGAAFQQYECQHGYGC